jgi:hypothetical protein
MACPHAAGVVALLVAHSKTELTFHEVRAHLRAGAETDTLIPSGRDCGGVTDDFPNYAFGYGRINALRSLQSLRKAIAALI